MAEALFHDLRGHAIRHHARPVGVAFYAARRLTTRDRVGADEVAVMEARHLQHDSQPAAGPCSEGPRPGRPDLCQPGEAELRAALIQEVQSLMERLGGHAITRSAW